MVSKEKVIEELKKIIDPHTSQSVYDMGLIKNLEVKEDEINLTFVPSSPFCPLGVQLAFQIRDQLKNIEGVKKVNVKVEGHVQQDAINEMLKE